MRRHLSIGPWVTLLSLVLAGGCGDSAHTLGSTGDGGRGGTGSGGTTTQGGAGGGGTGGSGAGRGGTSGAGGAGGAGATAGGAGGAGTGGAGGAGTGGTGATAGGGGGLGGSAGGAGGRGGASGAAGGAAGRGGTGGGGGGGTGGGGTTGTAGRGGTGGGAGAGGAGGTGGVAGAGGAGANACLNVQTLDRSCTTDADCFAAVNVADCCGRHQWIGLRTTVQSLYTSLEQECKATWPACGCQTRPTITDDGSTIKDGMTPSGVGVTCQQGVCTTFVRTCGGPCAAGLTCFSCQIIGGQYGACTTPCTDTAASSDCTNAARPLCQQGLSGNVDGTYCTAAAVVCDRRSSLSDCTGLVCGSNQQSVKVRNPALGTNQCACVDIPSTGRCTDCTCGEALCTPYGAHCTGFALEGGLLCSLPG